MVVTSSGPVSTKPLKVSWRNLATGRTGTSVTDYGTNLLGPAPGGILYAEQTPTTPDTSSDIILRAPDGSKRKLAPDTAAVIGGEGVGSNTAYEGVMGVWWP